MPSFNNSGFNSLPKPIANEIWVDTPNGYAAVFTGARRFTTVRRQIGKSITYIDDVNNGATIIINEPGLYTVSYADSSNTSAPNVGIFLNRPVSDAGNVLSNTTSPETLIAVGGATLGATGQATITSWFEAGSKLMFVNQAGDQSTSINFPAVRVTRIA